MEMFYLVLTLYNSGIAIIPEKYPTEEACEKASEKWGRLHYCIPAPVFKNLSEPSRTPYPGYYCGQFDCTLNNGAK